MIRDGLNGKDYILRGILTAVVVCLVHLTAFAGELRDSVSVDSLSQTVAAAQQTIAAAQQTVDSLQQSVDIAISKQDSAAIMRVAKKVKVKRNWTTWKPDPQRAMWLAIVLPGAGQIYNHKYWKLPIVYGGFVGCAYAMRWNNQMYLDYSQAYLDIMDDDPTTESYNQFLHLGGKITDANRARYQQIFKSRKDRYRRWRDMSFFCILGVYALSIIDAYVDASLSQFDISDDLSLRIEPGFVNTKRQSKSEMRTNTGLGINCSLTF